MMFPLIKIRLFVFLALLWFKSAFPQSIKLYIGKGISEQVEFIKGKDQYHGQTLSLGFKNTFGIEFKNENTIYQIGYTRYDVGIPINLRYLNSPSTKNAHYTSDGNIAQSISLGYGKNIVFRKYFSIDIFSGFNFGLFKDIKAYKNPKSPPPQRSETYSTVISAIDSSLKYSSYSMDYFTSKIITGIPLNFNLNFKIKNFGISLIPFFELGLNNFHRLKCSYYIPAKNLHGYAVSKSNGTNYGINFRASYSINFPNNKKNDGKKH
jgi:hypothetical protein